MIQTIFTIFIVINILAGLACIVGGFWPSADPAQSKSLITILIYELWGAGFLGLAWAVWAREGMARLWTYILYGLIGLGTLSSLIAELGDQQNYIYKLPVVFGAVYLLFFAFAIAPIVFMLRRDVNDYFIAAAEERARKEAEYRHPDQNLKMRE